MDMASEDQDIPPHVEETVAAIVQLHTEHQNQTGSGRRFVSRATAFVSRPRTLAVIAVCIAGWIAINATITLAGWAPPDPFPYPFLATVLQALALCLASMILIVQRHDDELSARRDQLTLELAILSERKTAKIIALLEEFRRNDPHQSDRRDEDAEALAEPADPQVVLSAIRSAHEKAGAGEQVARTGQSDAR
jgi:uncharacterized membrane protein